MYFEKHIRPIVLIIIVILLSFYSAVSSKTIYKWTDKNGQIHITDDPPRSGIAVEIDRIEYKEPAPNDTINKSERSIASYIDELKKILKEYGYGKSAQSRYLRQVSLTRYMDLTMTDIIGPECDFLSKTLDAVGIYTIIVISSIILTLHVFLALCFYRIIQKISSTRAKLVFVPVINIFPLIKASGKPAWWGLLLVVPIAGIFPPFAVNSNIQLLFAVPFFLGLILFTLVWVNICKELGFKKWAGLLILVPFVQIILPAYLALKRNDHPDRAKHLESATRELYFHLLSSRKIGFESGSVWTSKGPVAVKLEQFKKGKNCSRLKLKVRLVHLPNFILESGRFCKFAIKEVITSNGDNVHCKEHPLEKKVRNEVYFKEIESPFVHFEADRDVQLSKEISMKDIKSISGEMFLRLPLNIQSLDYNLNHVEREEYTNKASVILKDVRNNLVSLLYKGSIRNYVTTFAYGFKGRPLLHKVRSFNKIDDKNFAINEVFRGKVDRIKVCIADNYLEQRYPFELKL